MPNGWRSIANRWLTDDLRVPMLADLDRSTAFYKKLFGFTDLQDPDGYWIEINDALKK